MSSPPSRSAEAELIGGRCGKYTTFFKYGKKYLIHSMDYIAEIYQLKWATKSILF